MSKELETIIAFVEGRLSGKAFAKQLSTNPKFKWILEDDPDRPPVSYVGKSVFSYLNQEDLSSFIGVMNSKSALGDYLNRKGIQAKPDTSESDLYSLILSSQPNWLDVDIDYVLNYMLPDARALEGEFLKEWLQQEFKKRFRYVTEPPHWIQSPDWIMNENRPLIFLGQFDVEGFFHDTATVYTFYDEHTGSCETLIQVY